MGNLTRCLLLTTYVSHVIVYSCGLICLLRWQPCVNVRSQVGHVFSLTGPEDFFLLGMASSSEVSSRLMIISSLTGPDDFFCPILMCFSEHVNDCDEINQHHCGVVEMRCSSMLPEIFLSSTHELPQCGCCSFIVLISCRHLENVSE